LTSTIRRTLLKRLIGSGIQVTPDALEYILDLEKPTEAVESIIVSHIPDELPPVLSEEHLKALLQTTSETVETTSTVKQNMGESISRDPVEKDVPLQSESTSWDISVLMNPDSDSVGSGGSVEDFLDLFNDRFKRIKEIYMNRIDTQSSLSPLVAQNRRNDAANWEASRNRGERSRRPVHKVIGIVRKKWASSSRYASVTLEDPDGYIHCIIPTRRRGRDDHNLLEKSNSLLLDEVVCLSGHINQDGKLIANDILFPDIPTTRELGHANHTVYAAFISDIHFGSKEFLADDFERFIDWLRGVDVNDSKKEVVRNIRYLFIAGDLVDGIGVYPNQRDDLLVPDIYEQYAELADKLRKVPERVKIVCIPGNHDACRQALPKPPIPEKFAGPLYDLGNQIMMFGDPCQVVVDGVNILVTHGDSLDDLVTTIPGASYKEPAEPMKHLLRKRHLAPYYGGKTQLAPLPRDWMVIDTPPDIVHFGHAHHNAIDRYRSVRIINSGTFQDQTEFMRKQGIKPTPGIVSIVNLRTGVPDYEVFHDYR